MQELSLYLIAARLVRSILNGFRTQQKESLCLFFFKCNNDVASLAYFSPLGNIQQCQGMFH